MGEARWERGDGSNASLSEGNACLPRGSERTVPCFARKRKNRPPASKSKELVLFSLLGSRAFLLYLYAHAFRSRANGVLRACPAGTMYTLMH